MSYSDNRWSRGGLYEALGFRRESAGEPSYWYFRRGTTGPRVHRYTWRKSVALETYGGVTQDTEWDIMSRNGWDRIWDCGSARWVLDVPPLEPS